MILSAQLDQIRRARVQIWPKPRYDNHWKALSSCIDHSHHLEKTKYQNQHSLSKGLAKECLFEQPRQFQLVQDQKDISPFIHNSGKGPHTIHWRHFLHAVRSRQLARRKPKRCAEDTCCNGEKNMSLVTCHAVQWWLSQLLSTGLDSAWDLNPHSNNTSLSNNHKQQSLLLQHKQH